LPFIAGAIALGRRSWVKSAFVSAWFLSYLLVRGSAPGTSIGANSWFGAFMPAFPAFVIACCAIPLLVPRLGQRLAEAPAVHHPPPLHWRDRRVVAAGIVLAALPILVVAGLPVQKKPNLVAYADEHALVPVDRSLQPQASAGPGAVQITWPAVRTDGADSFYTIFRSQTDASGGVACTGAHGAPRCVLTMQRLASSIDASYLDFNPEVPSGSWTYRIGLAANSHSDPSAGGLTVISPPVDVTVP
jgi:hypothetical protein